VGDKGFIRNGGYRLSHKERAANVHIGGWDREVLRAWAKRDHITLTAEMHFAILGYFTCRNDYHVKKIADLEAKCQVLALKLKQYRDRFGEILSQEDGR
jgi:hypothetical protein